MPKTAKKPKQEKNVWLWLSPEDHQRLREAAAKRGLPMSEFSKSVVLDAIAKVLGKHSS